jgi:hypothetical protein
MKKRLFPLLVIVMFLGMCSHTQAQNESKQAKIKIDFGADLYSRYIWRGSEFGGNSPSIQPQLSATYNQLLFGVWGAYSLGGNNASQEVDFFVNYTFLKGLFTASVTDYFFPTEFSSYNYFNYKTDETGHLFEAGLSFNGTKTVPITFSAYVNFYGADALKLNNNPASQDFNRKTGLQYSNYFELAYTGNTSDVDYRLFVGGTLNKPEAADTATGFVGETGFYGNGPGIVNLGICASKTVKISKTYSLPFSTSLITNPQTKKVYFVFGISF